MGPNGTDMSQYGIKMDPKSVKRAINSSRLSVSLRRHACIHFFTCSQHDPKMHPKMDQDAPKNIITGTSDFGYDVWPTFKTHLS